MPEVELLYASDCPNVDAARASIQAALSQVEMPPRWRERRIDATDTPDRLRGYGSPTVLVEGRDVAGAEPGTDACCRLYPTADGVTGVPPVETIVEALRRAGAGDAPGRERGPWRTALAAVPAVGVALLPKVACPACWPAYAGVLGALGLGFLMDAAWLLPLTGIFLVVAVGALAFRARQRRGYGPFAVGLLAALAVMLGKFALDSDAAMYGGLALLVGASLWNSWPKETSPTTHCAACVQSAQGAKT